MQHNDKYQNVSNSHVYQFIPRLLKIPGSELYFLYLPVVSSVSACRLQGCDYVSRISQVSEKLPLNRGGCRQRPFNG